MGGIRYRIDHFLWSPRVVRFTRLLSESRSETLDLQNARSILVVKPDGLGDVILSIPFLRELRRNAPQARITALIRPGARNIVETLAYVDEWIDFQPSPQANTPQSYKHARTVAHSIADQRFDIAILARFDADYYGATYLLFYTGARRRVSYSEAVTSRKQRVNRGYDVLLTDALSQPSAQHEVLHTLGLLQALGGGIGTTHLEVACTPQDHAQAEAVMKALPLPRKIVALGVGGRELQRRWPMESFLEVALTLMQHGYAFVLIGDQEDRSRAAPLFERLDPEIIADATHLTLRESAALLMRCSLFIGNDSGPMHLAAAAKLPVVEISCHPRGGDPGASNSPTRFGPWQVPNVVCQPEPLASECSAACSKSHPHCILNVSVQEVVAAALHLGAALPAPTS